VIRDDASTASHMPNELARINSELSHCRLPSLTDPSLVTRRLRAHLSGHQRPPLSTGNECSGQELIRADGAVGL